MGDKTPKPPPKPKQPKKPGRHLRASNAEMSRLARRRVGFTAKRNRGTKTDLDSAHESGCLTSAAAQRIETLAQRDIAAEPAATRAGHEAVVS